MQFLLRNHSKSEDKPLFNVTPIIYYTDSILPMRSEQFKKFQNEPGSNFGIESGRVRSRRLRVCRRLRSICSLNSLRKPALDIAGAQIPVRHLGRLFRHHAPYAFATSRSRRHTCVRTSQYIPRASYHRMREDVYGDTTSTCPASERWSRDRCRGEPSWALCFRVDGQSPFDVRSDVISHFRAPNTRLPSFALHVDLKSLWVSVKKYKAHMAIFILFVLHFSA